MFPPRNLLLKHRFQYLLTHVVVIRLLVKINISRIAQNILYLFGETLAQLPDAGVDLRIHDVLEFCLFVSSFHVLPGKPPLRKVYQHVKQTLDVIPPALLNPQVRVN